MIKHIFIVAKTMGLDTITFITISVDFVCTYVYRSIAFSPFREVLHLIFKTRSSI